MSLPCSQTSSGSHCGEDTSPTPKPDVKFFIIQAFPDLLLGFSSLVTNFCILAQIPLFSEYSVPSHLGVFAQAGSFSCTAFTFYLFLSKSYLPFKAHPKCHFLPEASLDFPSQERFPFLMLPEFTVFLSPHSSYMTSGDSI